MIRWSPRPGGRVLMALAVTGALLTCFETPASAVTVPPAPPNGACYHYTIKAVPRPSNNSARVACSAKHTALTIAVGALPQDTVYDQLLASAAVPQPVQRACLPAFHRQLGSTLLKAGRSIYDWDFFYPTEAQWAAGARWFRCDVIKPSTPTLLTPLPKGHKRFLRNGLTKATRMCLGAQGAKACSLNPPWVQAGARLVQVAKSKLDAKADRICRAKVRRGAAYGYTWRKMTTQTPPRYAIVCFRRR